MTSVGKSFAKIMLFKEGQFVLLASCLIVQNLIPTASAVPAKAGSSSRSLEFHENDSNFGHVGNSINSEENVVVPVPNTGPYKITVYPWNNHLGRPATMEWESNETSSLTCKEIPSRWQGKVRSIDTHNNCVVLFSRHNCEGPSKIVKVGSPSHNRLSDICFQRKPISARPCTDDEFKAPITDEV